MTPQDPHSFIEMRTQALATVALTRSEGVRLVQFPNNEALDYFLQVFPKGEHEASIFRGVGVVIKGTAQPLNTSESAAVYLRKTWNGIRIKRSFSFPVIIAAFSMKNDTSYFGWAMKPEIMRGVPKLLRVQRIECRELDKGALDDLIETVNSWYEVLETEILT